MAAPTPAVSPSAQAAALPPANPTPGTTQVNVQVAPTADNAAPVVAAGNADNITPQTAQISGHVPLSRGWMITFGIIALLLVVFFVWRSRKGSSKKVASRKPVSQPTVVASTPTSVAPKTVTPMPAPAPQPQADMKAAIQRDMPRSPMSSVVTPSNSSTS
jgi:hypothetical protein